MKFLFCSQPFHDSKVDESYEHEYTCAKQLGLDIHLISLEQLIYDDNPLAAIKHIKPVPQKVTAIYRGWMLKPVQYKKLYDALLTKNVQLINTPEKYVHCHYLPESYEVIKDFTPRSVWLHQSAIDESFDNVHQIVKIFGQSPIMIKDFVKSRKHDWNEACYIPDASDKDKVQQVTRRFLELQQDELNEGIVFREFVKLQFLTFHSQSSMPLSQEYRIFFFDGEPLFMANYWEEGEYDVTPPDLHPFLDVAKKIQSCFFTMDIAKLENGSWTILELGDAQVSALPEQADPFEFFTKIKRILT
ncbi:ATP-grasp domain-containing protein [Brevibacillus sp. 179-C9.3 HS]|uniref:ATP-grasp domain-containing protein n=1 Tax=unclassified Brevibacillus TaxID=2684853 RepID=UPI00399FB020